jgi:uncharacterized lipoprotein YbaY
MKIPALAAALILAISFGGAGCAHLDLTPETDPQRVVTGTVNVHGEVLFPPEAEVVIRILDTSVKERAANNPLAIETPSGDRTKAPKMERILGEQLIRAPGASPIPFRVEFTADDMLMRHGLTLDARISYNGKVQYRTVDAKIVTLTSVATPHELWLDAVK